MRIPETYVWLVWASAFLLPWLALYVAFPRHRRTMLWASVFTTPFGLTEPLFVPEYWSPPSLGNLALRTGFDIESLIFCFGIGGVGAVLYNVLTRRGLEPLAGAVRAHPQHRFHLLALALPFLAFPVLWVLPWNPIYPGIVAMVLGALATVACRRDLGRNVLVGGTIFLAYYTVFLLGLEATSPGYVERVWNLEALSGIRLAGFPLEELLFAFAFGAYWAGVYEHFTWHRSVRAREPGPFFEGMSRAPHWQASKISSLAAVGDGALLVAIRLHAWRFALATLAGIVPASFLLTHVGATWPEKEN